MDLIYLLPILFVAFIAFVIWLLTKKRSNCELTGTANVIPTAKSGKVTSALVSFSTSNIDGVCMGNMQINCLFDAEYGFKEGTILIGFPYLDFKLCGIRFAEGGDGKVYHIEKNEVKEYIGVSCFD